MEFKFDGIDELVNKLDDLQANVNNVPAEQNIPLNKLFTETFMNKYSNFDNVNQFAEQSGFDFTNIEAIPESELDQFVQANTQFNSWDDMLGKASELYMTRNLGL